MRRNAFLCSAVARLVRGGTVSPATIRRSLLSRAGLQASLALLALVAHASDSIPVAKPGKPLLLRGATVHTVSGADLAETDVLMRDGKIVAIGAKIAVPAGVTVVDVTGKHVYPGLISAVSGMGLTEHGSVRGSVDLAETGALNPNARAQPALNPDSDHIPVSRANGILTALSVPMSTGLLAGTSTLIRMDGWTWEDLTLRAAVALHIYWPSMAVNRDAGAAAASTAQERTIADNRFQLTWRADQIAVTVELEVVSTPVQSSGSVGGLSPSTMRGLRLPERVAGAAPVAPATAAAPSAAAPAQGN